MYIVCCFLDAYICLLLLCLSKLLFAVNSTPQVSHFQTGAAPSSPGTEGRSDKYFDGIVFGGRQSKQLGAGLLISQYLHVESIPEAVELLVRLFQDFWLPVLPSAVGACARG